MTLVESISRGGAGSIPGPLQFKTDFNPEESILCAIDSYETELKEINKKIFDNPELGYEEFQAHDNIVALLKSLGFRVTPHAFGVETSFSCEVGSGGRVVVFNAEYDALPGIGHACGHNLIATASIASFLGLAATLKASNLPGRVRIYGTPAEEGGGGKLKLLEAGAYTDVDACLMSHPSPPFPVPKNHDGLGCCVASGNAYSDLQVQRNFRRFKRKPHDFQNKPHNAL